MSNHEKFENVSQAIAANSEKVIKRNLLFDKLFNLLGIAITFIGFAVLAVLISSVIYTGASRLDLNFITDLPSRFAEKAGIWTSLLGSVWIVVLTSLIAIPIGIAAAIYLEEYATKNRFNSIIEVNISNLAGVPSIIYGLLGLEFFNRILGLGGSLITGSLTLALLILPIIIVASREAIKAVPNSLREASYALGATKWQTIILQVIPSSMGGMITGIIIAISRAIGETAPLIVVGALAYVPFVPESPMDSYSVLPMLIFNWTSRPQEAFIINAAAGIIILLLITLILNAIAVSLRHKWIKKMSF